MTVGTRIRNRRLELNMTMEELGEKLGVKRWTVNKYEKDQIDLSVSTIKALHEILGISYMELLDDDSEDTELLAAYHRAKEDRREDVRAILKVPKPKKSTASSAV